MASELTLSASLHYLDAEGTAADALVNNLVVTLSSLLVSHGKKSVGTVASAIPLGGIVTPGFVLFVNRDATNFVQLVSGPGGDQFAKLRASGGFALLELGADALVPYWVADTAACQVEFWVFST